MPPAGAGDPAGADLALLRDVAAQLVLVLVVDFLDLLFAEVTVALSDRARRRTRPSPAGAATSLLVLVSPGWHRLEGDVVVGRGRAEVRVGSLLRRAGGDELRLAPALPPATPAAQEPDRVGDDLAQIRRAHG